MSIQIETAKRLSDACHILAVCHVSPDGDAIGSLLGLGLALRQAGRQTTLACADPVPEDCRHLPGWQTVIQPGTEAWELALEADPPIDLLVSLDCSDLLRLGKAYDAQRLKGIPVVNIDHHATNRHFGDVNWVDAAAAATAQLIVCLIDALGIHRSADVSKCLLNGILTDTQGFRTPNTSGEVLCTAVELMNTGASLAELTEQVFNRRPYGTLRMWSLALQNMHLENRILWSEITHAVRMQANYRQDGDAGLVNFLNTTNEADISVVFDELEDGQINVSMRATPEFDVSQVALSLGGGGHAQAAGCTLPGPIESARERVLAMLRQAWLAQTSKA